MIGWWRKRIMASRQKQIKKSRDWFQEDQKQNAGLARKKLWNLPCVDVLSTTWGGGNYVKVTMDDGYEISSGSEIRWIVMCQCANQVLDRLEVVWGIAAQITADTPPPGECCKRCEQKVREG